MFFFFYFFTLMYFCVRRIGGGGGRKNFSSLLFSIYTYTCLYVYRSNNVLLKSTVNYTFTESLGLFQR